MENIWEEVDLLGCDWLQAPILASFTHVCTTPLRGRWSDGQLALLFSIAFLFAARGMFGSQSIDASNVSPMPSGVLHVVIALVKPPAHV